MEPQDLATLKGERVPVPRLCSWIVSACPTTPWVGGGGRSGGYIRFGADGSIRRGAGRRCRLSRWAEIRALVFCFRSIGQPVVEFAERRVPHVGQQVREIDLQVLRELPPRTADTNDRFQELKPRGDSDDANLCLPFIPYALPHKHVGFDAFGTVAIPRQPFSTHPEAVKCGGFE